MPVEIRGNAILKIETINEIVDEMLGLIRERMRLTESQAGMLEPICRRAVHQIARRVEFQPPVFGPELMKIVGASRPERAADEVERLFGPGWIVRVRGPAGMGLTRSILMSRATLLALMDEKRAKEAGADERKAVDSAAQKIEGRHNISEASSATGRLNVGRGRPKGSGKAPKKREEIPEELLTRRMKGQRARWERARLAKKEKGA